MGDPIDLIVNAGGAIEEIDKITKHIAEMAARTESVGSQIGDSLREVFTGVGNQARVATERQQDSNAAYAEAQDAAKKAGQRANESAMAAGDDSLSGRLKRSGLKFDTEEAKLKLSVRNNPALEAGYGGQHQAIEMQRATEAAKLRKEDADSLERSHKSAEDSVRAEKESHAALRDKTEEQHILLGSKIKEALIAAAGLNVEQEKLALLKEQLATIEEQLAKRKEMTPEDRNALLGEKAVKSIQLDKAQQEQRADPAAGNPFAFGTIANRNFESDQGGFGTIAGRDMETKDPSAWGSLAHSDAMLGLIPLPKDKSDQEKPITEKEMHNVLA